VTSDQGTAIRRVALFRLSKAPQRSLSKDGAGGAMKQSRFALWLCRMTLALCALIFASVSLRFIFNTVENGAYLGMVPGPSNVSLGVISIRVGYGIYPVSFVIVCIYCLATSQFRAGLSYIAIMMTLLWSVRIVNGLNGGALAENPTILVGSGVMLGLSVIGLLLQARLRGTPA
jgi:hypothetical protein